MRKPSHAMALPTRTASSPLPESWSALAGERFDEDGNLTDAETRQEIRDLLVSLATWTRRLQGSGDEAVAS